MRVLEAGERGMFAWSLHMPAKCFLDVKVLLANITQTVQQGQGQRTTKMLSQRFGVPGQWGALPKREVPKLYRLIKIQRPKVQGPS